MLIDWLGGEFLEPGYGPKVYVLHQPGYAIWRDVKGIHLSNYPIIASYVTSNYGLDYGLCYDDFLLEYHSLTISIL